MRSLILVILLAASALSLPAAASECLPSAAAVRAAYGQSSWATYHSVNGHRCYSLGERHGRSDVHRSVAHHSGARAGALREIPIVNQLSAAEGKRLADEIWSWRGMLPRVEMPPEAKQLLADAIRVDTEMRKAKMAEAKR